MAKDIKIKFTIDGIEKEVDNLQDFTKEMKKAGAATEEAEKKQGFFSKRQEELKERMDGLKATLGEVKTGFMNGVKGLKNFAGGFKTAGGAVKNFGRLAKGALAATGIGLLVAAVVSLIDYFKNLEGGARTLQKIMKGLGAIVTNVSKAFSLIIKGKFKEAFSTLKDAVVEATEAVDKQFDAASRLSEIRQKNIIENAKLTQEIEKQKKVLEDSTLSTEERLAALDKVTAATKALAENQREETKAALEQAEAELVNIANYEERRQKQEEISQLQADLIDQTTALQNIEYDAARVAREIRTAEAEEKKRLHEEEMARIEEENAAKEEAAKKEAERQAALTGLLQQYALEDIDNAYQKAQAELQIQRDKALEEAAILGASEEELAKIRGVYTKKEQALAKENAEYKKSLKEAEVQNDIDLAKGAFGAVAALAGEGSAVAKAAALAQIGIDTYVGAQKAFNSQFIPGDPTSAVRATIAAGTAVAFGIANAQKVLATPVPGGETGGGTVPSAPALPSFTPQTGTQDAGETLTLGEQSGSQAVIKAYVVDSEMTSAQEATKRINDLSRL